MVVSCCAHLRVLLQVHVLESFPVPIKRTEDMRYGAKGALPEQWTAASEHGILNCGCCAAVGSCKWKHPYLLVLRQPSAGYRQAFLAICGTLRVPASRGYVEGLAAAAGLCAGPSPCPTPH